MEVIETERYFPAEAYLLDEELNNVPPHPEVGSDGRSRTSVFRRVGAKYPQLENVVWAVESVYDRQTPSQDGLVYTGTIYFFTTSQENKLVRLGTTDNFVMEDGCIYQKDDLAIDREMDGFVRKYIAKLEAQAVEAPRMAAFG